MSDTYLAIQTLGFATGTVLFGLLAVLSYKATRLSERQDISLHSAWLGTLWNVGMLVEHIGRLAGVSLSSRPMRLVSAAAYTTLALLPTVFLAQAVNRYEKRQPLRGKRWLLFSSCAIAAALTLNLFVGALDFRPLFFWPHALTVIAYNLVLHLAAIFLLFQHTRHFPARAFVRVELWLLVGLAITLMLSIHAAFDTPVERTIRVISQQSGIPIALTAIASLSRFRFADVFIKRSFTILAAVVTVLLYSLFIVRPLLRLVRASARYPEAASWVVMTLLGCVLLLVFPAIKRWIYEATDRWLFQRPDYNQLSLKFAHEIERVESQKQLFSAVKQHLKDALQVESVRILTEAESEQTPETSLRLPVKVATNVSYALAVDPGRGGRKLLSDELAFLSSLAERIGRRLEALQFEGERRERELCESRLQHSLAQAELRALQAQINPHFLFNTLNTIADLISSEPEKAEAMTERLAEVFRYVLARAERNSISVSEEFDFLRTYLAIEQVRFGQRLRVEMTIDPAIANSQLPPLILQPIVENAIKHGLSPKRESGWLKIQAEQAENSLRLTVEDNGAGWNELPSAKISSRNQGVGLKNVRERLLTIYEGHADLQISSNFAAETGQGTQITITIPLSHQDEAQNADHRRRSFGAVAPAEAARRAS